MDEAARRTSLSSPRFLAFLVAQFLGAANDNAYKVTLVLLILATVPDERSQVLYASLATAFFPVPFLLFSPIAGYFADRHPKHRVLLATKLPEILAMGIATAGFAAASLPLLLLALFLMATQSAFFSPPKYGILPEVFGNEKLSLANGLLELTTNLAILTGSIAGVVVYGRFKDDLVTAGLGYLAVAVVGTIFVALVPRAPAGNPAARFEWNVLSSAGGDWREARKSRVLFYTLLGIAWFSFLGSFFLTLIPVYGKNVLGLAEESAGSLLAILSVGIAAGSILAGRLSKQHVEIGLVPLGAIGISAISFHLALGGPGTWSLFGIPVSTTVDLLVLGLFSGFFIVPLNALLQQRSPAGMKGRLIAFSNVLSFSAVLLSAAIPSLLATVFGMETGALILFVAALTLVGTAIVVNIVPDFLVRLVLWLLTNTIYRIRVVGAENIPREGALFVANHVSWVDFLLIGGACDRMIRFLMYRGYYEWRLLNGFFRRMGTIPVAGGDPPEKTEQSLAIAREQIAAGHAVCIFAEGAITRTGNLLKFRRGFERIAAGAECPIVPIYLDGLWGSIFSFEGGKFFLKRPRRLFAPVTVVFGEPMPPTARAHEVRQRIQELSVRAFEVRKERQRPLHREFFRRARRSAWRTFAVSAAGERIRYATALARSLALSTRLFRDTGAGEPVGILLPPGIPAALVNLAATMAGRVAANLDFSEGGRWARRKIATAGLRTVVTSRGFLDRAGIDLAATGAHVVDVDGVLASPLSPAEIARAAACILLPTRLGAALFTEAGASDVDRTAALLFAYPDADTIRAVVITHHNLLSNIESLRQVFRVGKDDAVLGVLPFSHPVGLEATLWLPAITGVRVAYGFAGTEVSAARAREGAPAPEGPVPTAATVPGSASPAALAEAPALPDATAAARLAARERATLLPASPAVLARLLEAAAPDDLRTLRFVASGGEDLSESLREAFRQRFGVEPLEGYGRPECAPIVSLNLPDMGGAAHRQSRARPETTGHPLPGVSVRIVDPTSGQALPPGEEGILWVRGPNVMRGYLNDPEATSRVLRDGWLVTGDRARVDDEGFLTVEAPSAATP